MCPKGRFSFLVIGQHEVEARIQTPSEIKELDRESNQFKKILKGLRTGPDILINDFSLTEELDLKKLKAHSKNLYVLLPPYRINLKGSFGLKVSLTSKLRSDDIFLENTYWKTNYPLEGLRLKTGQKDTSSFNILRKKG